MEVYTRHECLESNQTKPSTLLFEDRTTAL